MLNRSLRSSVNIFNRQFSTSFVAGAEAKKSTKLWGGRFSKDTDESIKEWTESITIDSHLVSEDIWGSMAHVTMLARQGIVPYEKARGIVTELGKLQDSFLAGEWKLGYEQEDVHMNVEKEMINRLGMDVGGRMHTCRSRNDQVCLDSKLYTRKRLLELRGRVVDAVNSILERAAPYTGKEMVSYTHFQHAQPVSIAFWLTHYAAVLLRDLERLKQCYDMTDENPLGAGAISGTSFPIDRMLTSKLLGFQKVHLHTMDATAARDFMWQTLCSNAMISNSLSRLAEEFILFSSWEYSTLTMDDGFAMGSSMMPQKKNPGALELLRGRCARMTGYANAGFVLTKGLPSAYNRDFHEDKEILVRSMDLINRIVAVIPPLIKSVQINEKRMAELTYKNFGNATELANYLVSKHDVPFRESHHVVGSLVGKLTRAGKDFSSFDLCNEHLKECGINAPENELRAVLEPRSVMMSYNSLGGTGEESVKHMLSEMQNLSAAHAKSLETDNKRVSEAFAATRDIARQIHGTNNPNELENLIQKCTANITV